MSRSRDRVPFRLHPGAEALSHDELLAILRGADDLIMSGGRSLLAKLLKGSRAQKVLELGLQSNPAYGFYRSLAEDAILARIDRAIVDGWLGIEYSGRLPFLVFTASGWEIEKETRALEFFEQLAADTRRGPPFEVEHLRDRNRRVIWRLLDRMEESGDPAFIPLLQAWARVDYRKVRERIQRVIRSLENESG